MKIAIVGAGLAGSRLASRLKTSGFDPIVFDKARGAGGRTSSKRLGDWRVDNGAVFEFKYSAKQMLEGIDTRFETRINRYTDLNYDWVVCTAPPAQTAAIFAGSSLEGQINKVKMHPQFSIMLIARSDYSPKLGIRSELDSEILDLISTKELAPNIFAHTIHTKYKWTKDNLDADFISVQNLALDEFKKLEARDDLALMDIACHRWLYSRTVNPLGEDFLLDTKLKLACCGDWLLGNRAEHAIESADKLADYLCHNLL